MNRREFLKSLAALGTSLAIPLDAIAKASDSDIETAWRAVQTEPQIFYVGEYGTLSATPGPYDYPTSRREMFGWDIGSSAEDLINLAGEDWRIDDLIRQEYMDTLLDASEDDDWEPWLRCADEDTLITVQMAVNKWLDEMEEEDYEHADLHGYSARGQALVFFRDESETTELFNIEIIEGEHPGSGYYAAELRMEVEEANAIAVKQGIPIRFDYDYE